MSPEQARGKPVDRRTDIWSFGCVLYELFTARQVFETGETVSDAVAAILTREPEWSGLPPNLPSPMRRLLRRCLEKDPDRRLHHAADARLEIADAMSAPASEPAARRRRPRRECVSCLVRHRDCRWPRAPCLVDPHEHGRPDMSPVRRLELTLPPGVELFASNRTVAVSPDGARVVFVGVRAGTRQVYLRSLDQFEAVPLRGSDSATATFFAPDGSAVGVVTNTGAIRTISLADGLVTTVTDGANFLYGATWGDRQSIVFVRDGALWQVGASGGAPSQLTTLGGSKGDTLHAQPVFLPGGLDRVVWCCVGGAVAYRVADDCDWRTAHRDRTRNHAALCGKRSSDFLPRW